MKLKRACRCKPFYFHELGILLVLTTYFGLLLSFEHLTALDFARVIMSTANAPWCIFGGLWLKRSFTSLLFCQLHSLLFGSLL
ncbi:hypothetical protein C4K68_27375, partial [Pokkaliibacter plantistimulans]